MKTIKKVSHNAVKGIVSTYKDENLSLFGIINFIASHRQDKDVKELLKGLFPNAGFKSANDVKSVLSIDMVVNAIGDYKYLNKKINGKLIPQVDNPRKYFSIFTVVRLLAAYANK